VLLILLAGVAAGALNAVGGGGSFVALSALVAAGMPPAVYLTAAVIFLFAADVLAQPLHLVALLAGAILGGYTGAHLVRRLPSAMLRTLVLTTAVAMTAVFFVRAFR